MFISLCFHTCTLYESNKTVTLYLHSPPVHCICRAIGDEVGEAKASGNLGNTLKLLGRYDEAAVCCQRHLEITKAIYDKVCYIFLQDC